MMAINEYVELAITQMCDWFLQGMSPIHLGVWVNLLLVADVDTAEEHYHAHEFLDATVQPKPIYISPNEVYAMHSFLLKNLDGLVRIFAQLTTRD